MRSTVPPDRSYGGMALQGHWVSLVWGSLDTWWSGVRYVSYPVLHRIVLYPTQDASRPCCGLDVPMSWNLSQCTMIVSAVGDMCNVLGYWVGAS